MKVALPISVINTIESFAPREIASEVQSLNRLLEEKALLDGHSSAGFAVCSPDFSSCRHSGQRDMIARSRARIRLDVLLGDVLSKSINCRLDSLESFNYQTYEGLVLEFE
jgi:hypothetical protein